MLCRNVRVAALYSLQVRPRVDRDPGSTFHPIFSPTRVSFCLLSFQISSSSRPLSSTGPKTTCTNGGGRRHFGLSPSPFQPCDWALSHCISCPFELGSAHHSDQVSDGWHWPALASVLCFFIGKLEPDQFHARTHLLTPYRLMSLSPPASQV